MLEPLWDDAKIEGALDEKATKLIPYADAQSMAQEMQRDYEVKVSDLSGQIDALTSQAQSQAVTITFLNNNAASLSDEVIGLTAQVNSLKPDVTITIGNAPIMTSRFETALTHVDGADLLWANAAAKVAGMAAIAPAITYHQKHLMAWGTSDPWPWDGKSIRPPEPTAWNNLDAYLTMCLAMGAQLVLNTQLWPWHLRGKWQADGTTVLCTANEKYSDEGVIFTSRTADYLLLIRRMAERYLVAPYNVRTFITGCEYHGLYRGRDRTFNEWRWDDYAGTPGDNADMGAAYIHNITVDQILAVAATLKIDPATLTFINNYPPIVCDGKPTNDSVPVGHPLRERPWGTPRKQGLSILKNMIPLLKRVDAIGFDMSSINADGVSLVDDFASLNRYDDIIGHIKSIVPDKPLVIVETYDKPGRNPGLNSQQYRAAIRADAFRHMLVGDIWAAFIWGTAGEAMNPGVQEKVADGALLTNTSVATGGLATPMLAVVKMFHEHFGPGTPIYGADIVGDGVNALASDKVVMLISTTSSTRKVALGGDSYELGAYDVRVVRRCSS